MDPLTVATVFAVIALAELPDKSLFASLLLATRYRPLLVWLGVAAAFAVHVAIAVIAGGLLTLLPAEILQIILAVAFATGAAVLLLGRASTEQQEGEREAARAPAVHRPTAVVAASFGLIFLGEWGDITQIATANLAARYADPLSVAVAATAALWAVAGLAVTAGRAVLRWVPVSQIRRIAGVVLAGFAVAAAVQAAR